MCGNDTRTFLARLRVAEPDRCVNVRANWTGEPAHMTLRIHVHVLADGRRDRIALDETDESLGFLLGQRLGLLQGRHRGFGSQ